MELVSKKRQECLQETLIDGEGEGFRPQRIATNPDYFFRLRMIEQVEGGVNTKAAAAAKDCVGLCRHECVFPKSRYSMMVQ
jgi:hypothetical protein